MGMDRNWTAHRELWERAFGDTETYIQYYFANKAPRSRCFDNWQEKQLCAMAFFTPYEAVLYGEKIVLPYSGGGYKRGVSPSGQDDGAADRRI